MISEFLEVFSIILWAQSLTYVVLVVMVMTNNSNNHENADFPDFWKVTPKS